MTILTVPTAAGSFQQPHPTLSPEQEQAVIAEGHTIICACPGSGKTTVISHRAARLLQNPMTRGIAVTFGRHAVKELEQRIIALAPAAGKRITCGTFHKLAMLQLRDVGIRPDVIFDIHRVQLIDGILRELNLWRDSSPEGVAEVFQTYKANDCQSPFPTYLLYAFDRYQQLLRERHLIDLQDLIAMAVEGMNEGKVMTLKTDFLLVDEAQDLDTNQWKWIHAHAIKGIPMTAVGDDDQSIYGFRAAKGYSGMVAFRDRYGARTLFLSTSYRCPQGILETASRLVKSNERRFDKRLVSSNTQYACVDFITSESQDQESTLMAEQIALHSKTGTCGVLARNNSMLDQIEVALGELDIGYTRVESKSIWERPGPAMLLAFLDGLDKGSLNGAEPLILESGCLPEALSAMRALCNANSAASLSKFANLQQIKAGTANRKVRVIQQGVLSCYLHLERNDLSEVVETAAVLVKEIAPCYEHEVVDLCCKTIVKMRGSLGERVRFLQMKKKLQWDNVLLMTMHGSKGLEFDHVFIVGCHKAKAECGATDVEEERRVWYVAVTRAKKTVQITRSVHASDNPVRYVQEMRVPEDRRSGRW